MTWLPFLMGFLAGFLAIFAAVMAVSAWNAFKMDQHQGPVWQADFLVSKDRKWAKKVKGDG